MLGVGRFYRHYLSVRKMHYLCIFMLNYYASQLLYYLSLLRYVSGRLSSCPVEVSGKQTKVVFVFSVIPFSA